MAASMHVAGGLILWSLKRDPAEPVLIGKAVHET
jgi:hypothetical protein